MNDYNDKIITILHGDCAFIAGINWKSISLREQRNIKKMARKEKADYTIINRYRDIEGQTQCLAGMVKKSALKMPKKIKRLYSLGLFLCQFFTRSGYAILPLADGQYAFIGFVNGTLYNDVVGDKANIEQAKCTFVNFNSSAIPPEGWLIFVPEEWNIEDGSPFELAHALQTKKIPANAKFRSVSSTKAWTAAGVVVAVGFICYYLVHQQHEREKALIQQVQRESWLAEQQKADTPIIPPWTTSPDLNEFVRTCSTHWQSLPLSIAGWVFQEAQCTREGLRMAYRKPAGVTVADFSTRLRYLYQDKYRPFFNIPGQGDAGGYTVALLMADAGNTESILPTADEQAQRTVSFMQRQRIPINLSENDNRVVTANGKETILPWRSFHFSFETVVPPQYLFAGFNGLGIRLDNITVSLSKGRLTYKLEGHIYANP